MSNSIQKSMNSIIHSLGAASVLISKHKKYASVAKQSLENEKFRLEKYKTNRGDSNNGNK